MFKRTWDTDLTETQKQELKDAEAYVSKFGEENSYASHMVLMVRLAKIADELQKSKNQAVDDLDVVQHELKMHLETLG